MASATATLVCQALPGAAVHSIKADVSRGSSAASASSTLRRSFVGLHSHHFASVATKAQKCAASRKNGAGAPLSVQAVAAPAIRRGAEVEFETEVFKKEKISLAGGDEVCVLLWPPSFDCKGFAR